MRVIELITQLEQFDPGATVMLNMTTAHMEQFKFVSITFVDEIGYPDDAGNDVECILISHDEPGEAEDDNRPSLN